MSYWHLEDVLSKYLKRVKQQGVVHPERIRPRRKQPNTVAWRSQIAGVGRIWARFARLKPVKGQWKSVLVLREGGSRSRFATILVLRLGIRWIREYGWVGNATAKVSVGRIDVKTV